MRVAGIEWGLAISVLFLAAVSYTQTTYDSLVPVLIVIIAVSAALVVISAIQAGRSRCLGRFLLLAATFGFFWVEALSAARASVPFEISSGLPLAGTQFDISLVKEAILFIAMFQLMLLVGYSVRPPLAGLFRVITRRLDQGGLKGRTLRYLMAGCALLPIVLSFNFDLGAATESLVGGRGVQNPAYEDIGLLNLLGFFGLYGASLLLVNALLFRGLSRWQQLLVGTLVTMPFILSGVRHLWLFIAIPVGVVGFRLNSGKLTPGRLAKWIVGGVALLLVVQVQLLVRDEGWASLTDIEAGALVSGQSTGQFTALMVAESLVPERHEYFRELAEPYFLVHWIPRRFWPGKPIMESWTFYNDQYTQGDVRYNVTPSIPGQFYLNFGIFGVLYSGAFLGFLMITADRSLLRVDPSRQRAISVALGSFVAFILVSFRFYSPIYFTYFAFAWIGMLLITRRRPVAAPGFEIPSSAPVGSPLPT